MLQVRGWAHLAASLVSPPSARALAQRSSIISVPWRPRPRPPQPARKECSFSVTVSLLVFLFLSITRQSVRKYASGPIGEEICLGTKGTKCLFSKETCWTGRCQLTCCSGSLSSLRKKWGRWLEVNILTQQLASVHCSLGRVRYGILVTEDANRYAQSLVIPDKMR